jgi:2-phosphosulfolactate phosphatase
VRVTVEIAPGTDRLPAGAAAVIVDVLRATSTLTVALANGARGVRAASSPEDAFALKRRHPDALLCGEREGRRVEGFDLGNSPLEYPAEVVAGRLLVFASTNGSIAMRRAAGARRRVLAAFVNGSAAVETLSGERDVVIVCAGKLGRFSLEDALFAGWMCARLEARGGELVGAQARMARALAPGDATEVRRLVQGSSHGRYLRSLGPEFAADLEYCCGVDTIGRAFEI